VVERIKRFELIEARKEKGLSQKQLAKQLFIGQSAISKIENGSQPITLDQAEKIMKLLKVKLTDLSGSSKVGMRIKELEVENEELKTEVRDLEDYSKNLARELDALQIDLQIADLLTKMQNKEIEFDTFHRRLTFLEKQKTNKGEILCGKDEN